MAAEEGKEAIAELKSLQARAEQAQNQLAALQQFIAEATVALSTLNALRQPAGVGESLFPVGSGAFVKATLADSQKLLVEIGAGVVAEKTFDEASKILEERITRSSKAAERIQSELQAILARGDELNERLARLQK